MVNGSNEAFNARHRTGFSRLLLGERIRERRHREGG
jgi:hypothetical protein